MARPAAVSASASPAAVARAFVASHGAKLGIRDQARDLRVSSSEGASGGRSSVRFQQLHDGVPVFGGELVVNLAANGDVLSAGGKTLPPTGVPTTPRVSAGAARETAIAAIAKAQRIPASRLSAATPTLWISDSRILGGPGLGRPELVWRTEVTARAPRAIRELVLVDASLGVVVLHFDQIETALNRQICDGQNVLDSQVPCTSPIRSEGDPPVSLADANFAYDYSGITYGFYLNNFGRDSIDGAGMPLISTVRACTSDGCPLQNAFWDGSQMVYGEGFASADDVVGHELTHGVTDRTSHLFYYFQSGAINESLSDVMGELMDLTDNVGNDAANVRWLVGEDLPPSVGAIRNMANPPQFGDPDSTQSPRYAGGLADNGGVHTNSGVGNKAASLITDGGTFNGRTIAGLGTTKAARIYYEVDAHLLTSASDYQDLYNALIQACTNLVGTSGITAADCGQVEQAALATQMNVTPANAPAPEAPVCPAGVAPVNLFSDNLENTSSGRWAATGSWFYPQVPNPLGFDATYATSGTHNFWGFDQSSVGDYAISMTQSVPLPAGAFAYFRHAHLFENDANGTYDGGVVEYSTDNGATWHDAGPLFTDNGYNGTISPSFQNPLRGRRAFVADSAGYISSRINLGSLAGQQVRLRFRIGSDELYGDLGWFIDDPRIYTCGPPPAPAPASSPLPAPAPPASGPAPAPAPSPGAPVTPRITVGGRTKQKAGKTLSITVRATTEPVRATASGTVSVRASRRGKAKTYRLKTVSNRAIPAGPTVTIKLTVSKKTLSAIRRALRRHGSATARITVRARDAAGKTTTGRRTIRLKR